MGIALTRRLVPTSVQRNRLKRGLREAFRRHPVKRAGLDIVVTLRMRLAPNLEAAFTEEVVSLFEQAGSAQR